jgi:hypothetical protein
LASSRVSLGKDEWWHCSACTKFTYCRESTTACKFCKVAPRGKTASWLAGRKTPPKAAGASGSGGSTPAAKPWSTEEWALVTRHSKKNIRRSKNRADAAAKSAAKPDAEVEVIADDDMDLSAGAGVDTAKELKEVLADLAGFEAMQRVYPGIEEKKLELAAERDRLKAVLSNAKPPGTRLWAAKKQLETHVAARDKAASGHLASLAKMAKQLEEHEKIMQLERAKQEVLCNEMCAQEVLISEQSAIVAEASQQIADKNAKDAKLPAKTETLLAGAALPLVAVIPGDDAGLVRQAAIQAHRAAGLALEQDHEKRSSEFVPAAPAPAAADASAQQPPIAEGGLQPSEAELAKQNPPARTAGRASPYGPIG